MEQTANAPSHDPFGHSPPWLAVVPTRDQAYEALSARRGFRRADDEALLLPRAAVFDVLRSLHAGGDAAARTRFDDLCACGWLKEGDYVCTDGQRRHLFALEREHAVCLDRDHGLPADPLLLDAVPGLRLPGPCAVCLTADEANLFQGLRRRLPGPASGRWDPLRLRQAASAGLHPSQLAPAFRLPPAAVGGLLARLQAAGLLAVPTLADPKVRLARDPADIVRLDIVRVRALVLVPEALFEGLRRAWDIAAARLEAEGEGKFSPAAWDRFLSQAAPLLASFFPGANSVGEALLGRGRSGLVQLFEYDAAGSAVLPVEPVLRRADLVRADVPSLRPLPVADPRRAAAWTHVVARGFRPF